MPFAIGAGAAGGGGFDELESLLQPQTIVSSARMGKSFRTFFFTVKLSVKDGGHIQRTAVNRW